MMEGKPVIADAFFDVLLSDVKNERRQDEQGVVTLSEIAADMGFENRSEVSDEDAKTQSPLECWKESSEEDTADDLFRA
jgi:hypothetical protein